MKNIIYQILVWLSGAARSLLVQCSESEHIKHAGYGTLVLIPAFLGTISMTFAISTLTTDPIIYFGLGMTWGLIVLFIDRFMLSTFIKSGSFWIDLFSFKFLSRLVFAIGIGVTVSHPLVIKLFEKSIKHQLDVDKDNFKKLKKDTLQLEIKNKIAALDNKKGCISLLLSYEMAGGGSKELPCGKSSGIKDLGKRAKEYKEQIEKLNKEIISANTELKGLDSIIQIDLDKYDRSFVYDYIAEVRGLSKIELKNPEVSIVKIFLLILFIFVDILPIFLKLTTPMGEYDFKFKSSIGDVKGIIEHESDKNILFRRDVINRFFDYKQKLVDKIFSTFAEEPAIEVSNEINRLLFGGSNLTNRGGIIYPNEPVSIQVSLANQDEGNNIAQYKTQDFVLAVFASRIVFFFFVAILLLVEYKILDAQFNGDTLMRPVVITLVLTATFTMLTPLIPKQ